MLAFFDAQDAVIPMATNVAARPTLNAGGISFLNQLPSNVRFWHLADMASALQMSAFDPKRTSGQSP